MAREAKSLTTLRTQINAKYPNRDKKSDGGIGDPRHAKTKSDHNPNAQGVYRARDFTHNVVQGIDCRSLLAALLAEKDSRIKYIIFDGYIYNEKYGFAKRVYSGVNAHKSHLHISVKDDAKFYDDARDWTLNFTNAPTSSAIPTPSINLKIGSKGELVKKLQTILSYRGLLTANEIDSFFGARTEKAVKDYQNMKGLRADGIVGPNTAKMLGL